MPRGKPPPAIKTNGELSAEEKKCFFVGKELSVPHTYLQCLLSREQLHLKGNAILVFSIS